MEAKSIKKISDAELTEAGFSYGRRLAQFIEKKGKHGQDRKLLDSIEKADQVRIVYLDPSDSLMTGVEGKIIEAYISGADVANIGDNLQKMEGDSMLYTKPIMAERPDGSVEFKKALGITISRKKIILSIKD
jgi:hypothetical protein